MKLRLVSVLAFVGFAAGAVAACGSDQRPDVTAGGDGTGFVGTCNAPQSGCPCADDGASVECGTVHQDLGSYVQCSMGTRTCAGGKWGECQGSLIVTKSRPLLGTLAYADAGVPCGAIDVCNPFCQVQSDTPDLTNVPPGLTTKDGGLTLPGGATGGATCTSLTIAPAPSTTVTVTSFSPFTTSPANVQFTATFAPAGCIANGAQPTWTVTRPDLAAMSATGQLSLFGGVAGTNLMSVQAFFGNLVSNVVSVNVAVKARADTSGSVGPNTAPPAGQADKFWQDAARTIPATPTAPSDATLLYPYEGTFFPLGLPPPVVQYKMAANPGNTVKVVLRYPSGATNATATFEYALVVKEGACTDATQCVARSPDNDVQIVIPTPPWRAFEQSASGGYADLIIQRWAGSNLQNETPTRIFFVPGQLKGTVFYGTYTSPLNSNTGATMQISPGATAPTLGIKDSGKCVTCHLLNEDGSIAYGNGERSGVGAPGGFQDSRLYNLAAGTNPSTVLQNYNNNNGNPNPGIRFNYGAIRKDGHLLLTHGGQNTGDQNWRAPNQPSSFWDPIANPPVSRTFTGWPNNINAVTPRFSHNGDKIAFGFWSGTTMNGVAADATGKTLVVADLACPDAVSCSTGGAVSGARNVTPGMTGSASSGWLGWPSFTPDGSSVIFQRQVVSSNAALSWSPSKINSVAGAQAELWITKSAGGSTPTRLDLLNGIKSGVRYLPEIPRDVNPPLTSVQYHKEGVSFGIKQADSCGNAGTASTVSDTRLNYRPSVLPVEAGGYYWVVFHSRRMYGNIAVDNPWDPMPNQSCSSKTPPTKKLWVAAIDKNWAAGADPSHPAFYLPGQELGAGNSEADWVNQQCAPTNASCDTDADCCQSPQANTCQINLPVSGNVTRSCKLASACKPAGQTCNVDADCCGSPAVKCVGSGPKVCATVATYQPASFTRDFVASCITGSRPIWRAVDWQADIPSGTSISFSAQSGDTAASLLPAVPVLVASTTTTVLAPQWGASAQTVSDALASATPAVASGDVLRLTVKLDTNGAAAPTLFAWRVLYDCMPVE